MKPMYPVVLCSSWEISSETGQVHMKNFMPIDYCLRKIWLHMC